ncbi:MAG TPA: tRNA lysidine(34) synthetase TilS [Xanthomonadales bacterium]|nr:tRNA lysidine(34) synthetase TilS [Xanthomonadales bacterium]
MSSHSIDAALERALAGLPPGPLLLALSGGLDSTTLLDALARSPAARARGLRAIHVDHGLHASSGEWAAHCRTLCAALDVALVATRVAIDPDDDAGPEGAAREARYGAIAVAMRDGEIVLTAQHADDQAETLLLRLLRGSGVDGLAAMRALRPFARGWLARPWLELPRAAIAAHAHARGLRWVDDPSNARRDADRNFLRHTVMPVLRERWPDADTLLARSAAHVAGAARCVDERVAVELARVQGVDPATLAFGRLDALPGFVRGAVLRAWLAANGCDAPLRAVREIEAAAIAAREDAEPCVRIGAFAVRRYRDLLYVERWREPLPADWHAAWSGDASLALPYGHGTLSIAPAIPLPLEVRARRGGERIRVAANRPSQAVRTSLQSLGVPPWLRASAPCVWLDGELAAVGDWLVSDAFSRRLEAAHARLVWDRLSSD